MTSRLNYDCADLSSEKNWAYEFEIRIPLLSQVIKGVGSIDLAACVLCYAA